MICSFYVVVVAAAVAVAVAALSGGARVVVVPLVKKLVYKIIVPGCIAWDLELARLIEFLIILGSLYLNPKPSSPRPKAPKPKTQGERMSLRLGARVGASAFPGFRLGRPTG